MTEIILGLLEKIVDFLWAKGIVGMLAATTIVGWGAAAFTFIKNRGPKKAKKTEPTQIDHIEYIKKLHDKHLSILNELNDKYNQTVIDLNEKRIDDLKSLATEYNELASNTLSTLDRLIEQLSSRRSDLSSNGVDNGSD